MQFSKLSLGLLWLGLIGYAAVGAPPQSPETWTLIQRLATGDWAGINPSIIALFNLMGLWPLLYGAVLLRDGHGQRLWAWPFWLGSFALGAFALLPYLAWRQPQVTELTSPSPLIAGLEARPLAIALWLGGGALLIYGLMQGDWPDFVAQWQHSRFIHVMSLDFVALTLLFGVLLKDDMTRRGWGDRRILLWCITLTPLMGAATYLVCRPLSVSQTVSDQPST